MIDYDLVIRQIYPHEFRGMPKAPGSPRGGVNNIYSNVPLKELRVWVAKDPLCQLFAKQKSDELELELTKLKVSQILAMKKAKAAAKRGERMKPHNRQRRSN